MEIIFI